MFDTRFGYYMALAAFAAAVMAMITAAYLVHTVTHWDEVVAAAESPDDNQGATHTVEVMAVIDGDTFTATTTGGQDLRRIRVLGIDAPEMARDGNPTECQAQEATDAAEQLLKGRTVQISADPAEGERDRYDRLLAYVDVEGTDFAEVMLTKGHARLYEGAPLARQSAYDHAARDAQEGNVGLWGRCS